MILAIRTDKPEAELYLYKNTEALDSLKWYAHRELSDTLLLKIDELLERNATTKQGLTGIAVFKGPGSFTGLRIGISVANALAYSLKIPITGFSSTRWLQDELTGQQLKDFLVVSPEYGAEAHITQPRK